MVAANQADFLEGTGGAVDPFTGLAPAETPEEEARRRLLKLRYSAQETANRNARYGEDRERQRTGQEINPDTGQPYTGDERPDPGSFWGTIGPTLEAIGKDPVTAGVLAAPYAVLGAGAALGGLATGGAGSIAGTSASLPVTQVANEATGLATAGPGFSSQAANAYNMAHPFMMASPFPAAGAATGTAAGTAAAASAPMGAAGFATKYGIPALTAIAPLAIQQLTAGPTKEQKQLIEMQKQLALEAQRRQGQLQDQRMNALGQQMLAFNPRNQTLAQMYGPQAAFQPEQVAQMVQGQPPPDLDPSLVNYKGTDKNKQAQVEEWVRRQREYEAAEAARRQMIMNNFQAPGPGPAPIQMPTPQAARRY